MEIGGSSILVYFTQNGYDVDRLKPYEDFLIECKQKDIESYAKHKHHILPVFMGGGNEPDNFIVLTPEDHYNAHLVLAGCFEVGSDEYHYNLSSSAFIIKNVKMTLKKLFGDNVPVDLEEFWKQANIYMKDIMKGENNPMWGNTHSKEARAKISAAQKNRKHTEEEKKAHSMRMTGAGNPSYGKKRPHSPETIKILTEKSRQSAKLRFSIPEGVFEGEDIGGKRYWRYCPTCSKEIRHTRRDAAGRGHRDGLECLKCSSITGGLKMKGVQSPLKGKKIGKRPNRANKSTRNMTGDKNPNAKQILDPVSGIVYQTLKEAATELNIAECTISRRLKKGVYVCLGRTNSKEKRNINGNA